MNATKKFVTLVLAVVMALSISTAAFAITPDPIHDKFFWYEDSSGVYTYTPMGHNCITDYVVSGGQVTLQTDQMSYGGYTGHIISFIVDVNGDGTYDPVDEEMYTPGIGSKGVVQYNAASGAYVPTRVELLVGGYQHSAVYCDTVVPPVYVP